MIDLRSDTVSKPSRGMLEAMFKAQVGDDVFGDDPTVNELQEKMARLFGMKAALFCPSGTMTNQIAMRVLTEPQDEVICDRQSHVYLYEGGGMASNSQLSPKLLNGDRGRLTADMVREAINPDNVHFPRTRLVVLENTMNRGGGSVYQFTEIMRIKKVCNEFGLKLHLDGARLFNALNVTGEKPLDYGKVFDTISICFSKGLGAPVGSILLGNEETIHKAKRIRKAMGGGMRQSGYLAAACLYALRRNVARLAEDHSRAKILGQVLLELPFVSEVLPVETNIVVARLEGRSPASFLADLEEQGILAVPFGPDAIRMVTHLNFDYAKLGKTVEILRALKENKHNNEVA